MITGVSRADRMYFLSPKEERAREWTMFPVPRSHLSLDLLNLNRLPFISARFAFHPISIEPALPARGHSYGILSTCFLAAFRTLSQHMKPTFLLS